MREVLLLFVETKIQAVGVNTIETGYARMELRRAARRWSGGGLVLVGGVRVAVAPDAQVRLAGSAFVGCVLRGSGAAKLVFTPQDAREPGTKQLLVHTEFGHLAAVDTVGQHALRRADLAQHQSCTTTATAATAAARNAADAKKLNPRRAQQLRTHHFERLRCVRAVVVAAFRRKPRIHGRVRGSTAGHYDARKPRFQRKLRHCWRRRTHWKPRCAARRHPLFCAIIKKAYEQLVIGCRLA
mmetsp:Transcript_11511/g.31043  ORF Transcript_11511/g.31043 Transcript_11511/m.31043 type:complete len:241 (+) Transcript_11511:63-785(+)